jgi:hypothetical protein
MMQTNGTWVKQPGAGAFTNVYTKAEIDNMITAVYNTIMYYHKIQTSTDGTITFYALSGVIESLSIYGNGQQQGTPTPDNPVMPEFVGTKTANVMPFAAAQTITNNGITFESDGKGGYTVKGDSTANASAVFQLSDTFIIPISVENGGNGTLSFWNTKADFVTLAFMFNDTVIDSWSMNSVNRQHNAYNLLSGQKCNAIRLSVSSSRSYDQKIQPEFTDNGEYPTEFEPYGYKIPITCAGTTVNVYTGDPLRKALDGSSAVDVLSNDGTIIRNVDAEGNALATPTTKTIDFPDISIVDGENTLTVGTDLPPSLIEISGGNWK